MEQNLKIKELEEKMFCLNYELKTLSGVLTENKLERWLPGFTDPITDFDHQQRYDWACSFVKDKNVLDIACGSGKGSYILATNGGAKHVLGCDIETEAVKYSSIKYKNPNLLYEVQNVLSIKKEQLFDVIISFETIEHIQQTDLYLKSINSCLKDDGIFIVSTPISKLDIDNHPKNKFHVIEWGFKKFQEVVSEEFSIEKIYIQLHDKRPYNFIEFKLQKFILKKRDYKNTKIEEFKDNIELKKLGKQINGYQILICRKK